VVVLLVLLAASFAFSRLLRTARMHRYLSTRLEAAFGRPVEVGRFGFSLLNGLRLEADSVTVAEDPRFGDEHFLRAERMTARLRWRSLASGRFEFGTLSFTRPSLNLVRAADGHWNVESWLPPPAPALPVPSAKNVAARLYRIEVDTGRINFKRGVDKVAFALADVKGHLEQESAGRWRMDLEARPMRANIAVQEAGKLRLRGRIAGTSARLQPAELALTWEDVSLADALRLARGQDFGVRGRLAAELTGRITAPGVHWRLAGTARVVGAHRWDLPQRPGDPALNLTVEAQWRPGEARVELSKWVLEAPRSSLQGAGALQWVPAFDPEFRIASLGISFMDLLAWYRAFRPSVAEDLTLEGVAEGALVLRGWPLRLEQGAVTSEGAGLRVAGLREPIRLGPIAARVARERLVLEPVTITLPAGAPSAGEPATPQARPAQARQGGALRAEAAVGPAAGSPRTQPGAWELEINLAGQTERAEDLLVAAGALGRTLYRGWVMEGPASLNLRWQGTMRPFAAQPLGTIELHGLRLRSAFLNQPVMLSNARIELRPGERRVTLTAAQAFGAHWKGTLRWRGIVGGMASFPPWEFDLSADHLDAAELDRWFGPRARPGLLERIMPSQLDTILSRLRARGRISVDEVVVKPLTVRRLRAQGDISGRKVTLTAAQGDFYAGTVNGSLRAELSPQPAYRFQAQFERVNLATLSDATATLKGRFAGNVSGELELVARGVGRENLLASLEGHGALKVRGAQMRGFDLKASYAADRLAQGTTQFAAADGTFSLAAQEIQVEKLRLAERGDDFEASGSVDFSRRVDLRFRLLGASHQPASKTVSIAGPLDAPVVTRLAPQKVNR